MFPRVLKASSGGPGPAEPLCGRSVDGFAFCVTVSGWGKFMKIRHEHRVESQTVTHNSQLLTAFRRLGILVSNYI